MDCENVELLLNMEWSELGLLKYELCVCDLWLCVGVLRGKKDKVGKHLW